MAMTILAHALREGMGGFAVDETAAIDLLRRAAALDYTPAMVGLGSLIIQRSGNERRNQIDAFEHFSAAAQLDDAHAQAMLGTYFEFGLGNVSRNLATAAEWYSKAAAQEHPEAVKGLARLRR